MVCGGDSCNKNGVFDLNNAANRDNCYHPYYLLKNEFYEKDILLNTYDYLDKDIDKNYSLIFFDMPNSTREFIDIHPSIEKYLVIWECAIIKPINWDISLHKYFKKIFTWDDSYIDNKKYFKINFPNKIPDNLGFITNKKDKFCTIIAGNKSSSHRLELYSERVKAIRWFEQNHPEDFDLFGIGWDKLFFKSPFSKLNRLEFLQKLCKPNFPSYRGIIQSKKNILNKYKFSICYENVKDIPGYVTEKIFDCFFAGCVPIYFGAPNIDDHVPKDTFIDKRSFTSYEELYRYLTTMNEKEYDNYINNIKNFLASDKIYQFSSEYFAETIIRETTNTAVSQ